MSKQAELDWLSGGGEMGKLIRSMDWSNNPLGPIENWPQSLKTAVSLCLSSTFPINIAWGPDHIQIYNDAYRPICGALHPESMGSKFKECWASALPVVGAHWDRAYQGEGTYIPNQRMFLERYGYYEESFMTFSFSPIHDESGNVGGIFHPISESTEKMLSSRRTQVVRDLAIQIGKAQSLQELYSQAVKFQSEVELDLPFMIFFEADEQTGQIKLANFSGLEKDSPLLNAELWPLQGHKEMMEIKSLHHKFGIFKSGPYENAPIEAQIIPIIPAGSEKPTMYFVAGVSVARAMDQDYLSFYEQLRNAFSTAVTNIRAYEDEQRRAKALAEIDKAKTAFFSNVSHEFRTPLTLIMGPLEDALNDKENHLDGVQKERLDVVHRNAQRLLKLVNSLLDFSRIEAGRIQANFAPVNLSKLTADLASLFRSTIEKEGLKFNVECLNLPEEIYVDQEMWEKIILNLLSNAFKFTFDGSISVRMSWKQDGAELTITDSGIGIAETELPRLFERFHRVHGAKSRSYEGTGIGLALVQELIHRHGGTIMASSQPGLGTTFVIFIPKGNAHLPQDKIAPENRLTSTSVSASAYLQEAQMWNSKNQDTQSTVVASDHVILLADDNSDMRAYVTNILGKQWKVLSAQDGAEAFAMAVKYRPNLILSDVMMPIMDGFELLEKVRTNADLKSTPLVLLSARAGEEAKLEGLAAGADDYLVKPFSAKELTSRIEALLKMTKMRKTADQEISDDAEKFRATFSHASVNIAMVEMDGTIREINQAFLDKAGYEANEVLGKHFSTITHPDDVKANLETIQKLTAGEILSATFEKRYKKKDGTYFWVQTSLSSAFGSHEKPLYLMAVSQDIDSIKLAEQKYRTAVEGLQVEKDLRERFVATLTHDLRSPITAAKISAQLIQRKPDNMESSLNYAARIVSNVNRADQMIQDLLDANRVRAGEKLHLNFIESDLIHFLSESIDNLRTLHGDRIIFETDLKSFYGRWAGSQIGRILDNLVNNAIKYGDPHGSVSINITEADQKIKISVHNRGNPLSQSEMLEIFNPYKRSGSAAASQHKGWGLGLTLVKGVADAHNGSVEVTSSPEEGTIFSVVLPKVGVRE